MQMNVSRAASTRTYSTQLKRPPVGTVICSFESNEILQALREIGVDYAQGYAIGKPEPFETMYPLLADAHREVA